MLTGCLSYPRLRMCSPSDVMTVLRQVQTFLLTQHSQGLADLTEYVLQALLGMCQVIDMILTPKQYHSQKESIRIHS